MPGLATPRLASRMRFFKQIPYLFAYKSQTIDGLQIPIIIMLVCDIYNKSSWVKVCEKRWMVFMYANVYDVALRGNTARNLAVGPWRVGHLCYMLTAITRRCSAPWSREFKLKD